MVGAVVFSQICGADFEAGISVWVERALFSQAVPLCCACLDRLRAPGSLLVPG